MPLVVIQLLAYQEDLGTFAWEEVKGSSDNHSAPAQHPHLKASQGSQLRINHARIRMHPRRHLSFLQRESGRPLYKPAPGFTGPINGCLLPKLITWDYAEAWAPVYLQIQELVRHACRFRRPQNRSQCSRRHCSSVIPNQRPCNRPTRQFKGVLTSLGKLIGHALPKLTVPLGVCLSN